MKLRTLVLAAVLLAFLFGGSVRAETTINGNKKILGTWDASGSAASRVCKVVATDCGTCTADKSECCMKSTGDTIWLCTGTNTWSQLAFERDAEADGTTKGMAAFTAADFDSTAGVISLDVKAKASGHLFAHAALGGL